MGRTLQQAKTEHSRIVMMLKATPENKPEARQDLYQRAVKLEAEIRDFQSGRKKTAQKSSGIDLTMLIIIVVGVVAVFAIAFVTGIAIT